MFTGSLHGVTPDVKVRPPMDMLVRAIVSRSSSVRLFYGQTAAARVSCSVETVSAACVFR
jgi:hypothetical protein